MPDMDERIERAARAAWPDDFNDYRHAEGTCSDCDEARASVRASARKVIEAAFPELFDGTAWITKLGNPEDWKWPPGSYMRPTKDDAHLKGQETDSKVEG